ncbi:MAG: hypothetical protein QM740_20920 [Acidovorax sp.]
MSTAFLAKRPTQKVPPEHFPSIQNGLVLTDPHDRSALTVCGLSDIDRSLPWHDLKLPRVALRLDDVLVTDIGEECSMHPLRHTEVGNDYYIEYLRPLRTLWLRYQQILGGRLLMPMTEDQAQRFEAAAVALRRADAGSDQFPLGSRSAS